ncbi:hypothetical protein J3Q64DRAFT_1696608 [Phycomyces blakesleeanus]|uniref:Ubiquitin-like domain-containing protein n=2 Tax=Phycomyces blakesleeanus TaxID=4837 RepID=A0A162Q1J7_PHYB8|nr:hypothetical protein PHYBLDRAFT_186251 [Phycomyces blakesleeanus NRRL 1555(-)]OAD76356.1 hypothetical protein PHYBLDRAFT_186251 [Phycomyces blakesleeanus NRRL 1555(-)]|eukprot:XP_018294396.1 hypothetical protein PHYBLDRAFT_186251 [Phycomyces blakesleeanus NRRL 1555(-)]
MPQKHLLDSVLVNINSNDGNELIIRVSPVHDNILSIKNLLRRTLPNITHKNIRLIHNGRLLDDNYTLADYGLGTISTVYFLCSLSEFSESSTQFKDSDEESEGQEERGLDRLRKSGYNAEEIRSIRMEFHRTHRTEYNGETTEHQRQLEDAWMESTGETLPGGTVYQILCGLILGFFLGLLCLFWLREPVFTRKHRMGKGIFKSFPKTNRLLIF